MALAPALHEQVFEEALCERCPALWLAVWPVRAGKHQINHFLTKMI
jgi:hypothetical protein